MPKVTFLVPNEPNGRTVEFELGKLPYSDHGQRGSLLDVAMNFDIPLDHACGGNCACTTCHLLVREGEEHLSEADDDELDTLDNAAGRTTHSRLGCQTVVRGVKGDVVVEIPT
jgi:ferredoxin, 2Fe-2S